MNRNLINDAAEFKLDLVRSAVKHLPEAVREPYDRLEYDLMKQLNEVSSKYLAKTDSPKQKKETVCKVVVE